jgi:hypothetical protein
MHTDVRLPPPHPALDRAARLTRRPRPDPLYLPLPLNLTRATLLAGALLALAWVL